MKRLLSYTLFSVIFLFQSSAYADNITRSCTAKYVLHIKSASERYGGPIAQPEMFSFTAKGGCGKSVPNRCRKRARAAALVCMEFHLNNDYQTMYGNNKAPYYCSKYKRIYGYNIEQLSTKIRQTACNATPANAVRAQDRTQDGSFTIKAKVIARVYGKKGCAADKVLKRAGTQYPEWTAVTCAAP